MTLERLYTLASNAVETPAVRSATAMLIQAGTEYAGRRGFSVPLTDRFLLWANGFLSQEIFMYGFEGDAMSA